MASTPSTPGANETALREAFLPVRDPHERLALIAEACAGPGLAAELRQKRDLVSGCVSEVWVSGDVADGVLGLRWDAASPLVRGLVGLLCRVYQDCTAAEIRGYGSAVITDLGLSRQLSATRLRGLAAVEARIHLLAGI